MHNALGSAIGSGIGIINEYNITEIVENALFLS
jgi:thiazole synthase ThiGH ThiG subunit